MPTHRRVTKTRRVNLHINEDFAQQIEALKPKSLALSAFCAYLIEQHLTGGVDYPRTVSVRETQIGNPQAQAQPSNEANLQRFISEGEKVSNRVTPLDIAGVGVGRECEGTPRTGGVSTVKSVQTSKNYNRDLRPNLQAHEDLIRDFWVIKGGSKGDRAWSLLQTELTKLQTNYGDAVVRQQIELAINGKWKGITEANYARFLPSSPTPTQAHKKPLEDLQAEVDAWPTQSLW